MRVIRLLSASVAVSLALSACAADDGGGLDPLGLYSGEVQSLTIEIDYQTGAAPYSYSSSLGGSPWELLSANAEALFPMLPLGVDTPSSSFAMEELAIAGSTFTATEIDELAAGSRQAADSPEHPSVYVVILDGYFADSEAPGGDPSVLGVSIEGRRIVALFRPALDALPGSDPALSEQVALVHELGHVIGLVDGGLPMTSDHVDSAHGHHCDNPSCIMYYRYKGGRDAERILDQLAGPGEAVLFGEECLEDAWTAAGAI